MTGLAALVCAVLALTLSATLSAAAAQGDAGSPAPAPSVSAETFAQAVEGWTIDYGLLGFHYGTEQYLPGAVVMWRDAAGECQHGTWFARDGLICFSYEGSDQPRCWEVEVEQGRVSAHLPGAPPEETLREYARRREPLGCPAPDLGV